MFADRERVQLVLLRILGVLLILVGLTVIARNADGTRNADLREVRAVVARLVDGHDRCERVRVEVRVPRPPEPPAPPARPSW